MFGEVSENQIIKRRREVVFLILAGLFLGSLIMLNILGISRFIDFSDSIGLPKDSDITFSLAIGVLPYPITFLCTDFISEIYGRWRANLVVWVGLMLNLWVLFILWLAGWLDAPETLNSAGRLPLEVIDNDVIVPHGFVFYEIRHLAFGATMASMLAYMVAQFCDVHIFHWLKKRTKGKKLWLRNNASTLVSQLVDSVAVILITYYYANALPMDPEKSVFWSLVFYILSSYLFKIVVALLDTIPFYFGVRKLKKYLQISDELSV